MDGKTQTVERDRRREGPSRLERSLKEGTRALVRPGSVQGPLLAVQGGFGLSCCRILPPYPQSLSKRLLVAASAVDG